MPAQEELGSLLHSRGIKRNSNMPGAVARTSTMALAGATLPFGLAIANKGLEQAVKDDPVLALGVNVYRGKLTIPSVAEAHGLKYTPLADALKA